MTMANDEKNVRTGEEGEDLLSNEAMKMSGESGRRGKERKKEEAFSFFVAEEKKTMKAAPTIHKKIKKWLLFFRSNDFFFFVTMLRLMKISVAKKSLLRMMVMPRAKGVSAMIWLVNLLLLKRTRRKEFFTPSQWKKLITVLRFVVRRSSLR